MSGPNCEQTLTCDLINLVLALIQPKWFTGRYNPAYDCVYLSVSVSAFLSPSLLAVSLSRSSSVLCVCVCVCVRAFQTREDPVKVSCITRHFLRPSLTYAYNNNNNNNNARFVSLENKLRRCCHHVSSLCPLLTSPKNK